MHLVSESLCVIKGKHRVFFLDTHKTRLCNEQLTKMRPEAHRYQPCISPGAMFQCLLMQCLSRLYRTWLPLVTRISCSWIYAGLFFCSCVSPVFLLSSSHPHLLLSFAFGECFLMQCFDFFNDFSCILKHRPQCLFQS